MDRKLGTGSDAQQRIEPLLVLSSAREEKLEKNAQGAAGRMVKLNLLLFSSIPRTGRPCPTIPYLPYAKYAHNLGERQYRVLADGRKLRPPLAHDPCKSVAMQRV